MRKRRAQDAGRHERVDGLRGVVRIDLGEPCRRPQRHAAAEDRGRAREPHRGLGQPRQPRGDLLRDALWALLGDALGVDAAVAADRRARQLAQQERVAARRGVAGAALRVVGARRERPDHGRGAVLAQRRQVAAACRAPRRGGAAPRASRAAPPCGSPRRARRGSPRAGARCGRARRATPCRPSERRRRAARAAGPPTGWRSASRARAARRTGRPRRPRSPRRSSSPRTGAAKRAAPVNRASGSTVASRSDLVEQLADDAERERALELGAAGAQRQQPGVGRRRARGVEQRRLAHARRRRRPRPGSPAPSARPRERAPDRLELGVALEQPVGSCPGRVAENL